jgi:hypothetical protein
MQDGVPVCKGSLFLKALPGKWALLPAPFKKMLNKLCCCIENGKTYLKNGVKHAFLKKYLLKNALLTLFLSFFLLKNEFLSLFLRFLKS